MASSDFSSAQRQVAHLERQAARVHLEAQALNKAGRFDEARAKYDEMQRLENDALKLAAAATTCRSCETELERQEALLNSSPLEQARRWPTHSLAESAADYDRALSPSRFPAAAARARAAAAVCGAYAADCASVGVQWIYDTAVLEGLLEERRRRRIQEEGGETGGEKTDGKNDGGDVGLEFLDPVASPFLAADYKTGRPSPYGEETLVLIRALAAEEQPEAGALHCGRYAERYSAAFGGGGEGGEISSGAPPSPFKGYMNASTRGFLRNYAASGLRPPWSGADDKQADCVARVAPLVAAFGGDGGDDGGAASPSPSPWPPRLCLAVELATRTTQNDDEAVAWACAAALVLRRVCLGERVEDAARGVVGRLQDWAAESKGGKAAADEAGAPLPMAPALAADVAARLSEAIALVGEPPERAVAALGRNCHLPNSYQTPLHAALWGERAAEAGQVGCERAFVAAVRGALRGGGCCSSRAQAAGALLAARLGEEAIPMAWRSKCWDWDEIEEAAGRIAGV